MTQSFGTYSHNFEPERPRDLRCIVCGGREDKHDIRVTTHDLSRNAEIPAPPVVPVHDVLLNPAA